MCLANKHSYHQFELDDLNKHSLHSPVKLKLLDLIKLGGRGSSLLIHIIHLHCQLSSKLTHLGRVWKLMPLH